MTNETNEIQKEMTIDAGIRFQDFETVQKADGGDEKIFVAVISTPNTDRVGDRVLKGAFQNLSKTFPLLWSHDKSELPLGRSMWTKWSSEIGAYIGKFRMASSAKAMDAYQLIKEGIIDSVSVTFRVLDNGWKQNDQRGYDISKAELLEVSLVNIPANKEAMIVKVKGLIEAGKLDLSQSTIDELGLNAEIETIEKAIIDEPGHEETTETRSKEAELIETIDETIENLTSIKNKILKDLDEFTNTPEKSDVEESDSGLDTSDETQEDIVEDVEKGAATSDNDDTEYEIIIDD